jgi:hypothetical protein
MSVIRERLYAHPVCLAANVVTVQRSKSRPCKLGINTSHQRSTSNHLHYILISAIDIILLIKYVTRQFPRYLKLNEITGSIRSSATQALLKPFPGRLSEEDKRSGQTRSKLIKRFQGLKKLARGWILKIVVQ